VRKNVLEAVIDTLVGGGFERLTYDEVASRAGVHKTTIYRRWPTKADLVLDALHARSDLVVAMPHTGRLGADLVAFLRSVAANITSPTGRALVLATLRPSHEPIDLGDVRHRFWDERFARARARIDRAVDTGELSPGTDSAVLVEALVSPLFFRTFIRGEPVDDRYLRALVRAVVGSAASRAGR
jgi:AcrR family transcriptional regulator